MVAGARVPSASVFWDSWFGLVSPSLSVIALLKFLFRSLLGSFPVRSEEGSCLHVRQEQLFCDLHTDKITFLGKWDEREERPFLWPLASFPDRHTYYVHYEHVYSPRMVEERQRTTIYNRCTHVRNKITHQSPDDAHSKLTWTISTAAVFNIKTYCPVLSFLLWTVLLGPHQDPWLCDLLSDVWHEQPLNEVVEALAPNITVQFLTFSSWYKSL